MKAYLLTYSQTGIPTHIHRILDDTKAIETWVAPFMYAAILISKLDVHDLSGVLRPRIPDVWFVVTELNASAVQGWLPADFWEYVNNPEQAVSRNLFTELAKPSIESPPNPPS